MVARARIRSPYAYEGKRGHLIQGTDTIGRTFSIFTPRSKGIAQKIAAAAKLGNFDRISALLMGRTH